MPTVLGIVRIKSINVYRVLSINARNIVVQQIMAAIINILLLLLKMIMTHFISSEPLNDSTFTDTYSFFMFHYRMQNDSREK